MSVFTLLRRALAVLVTRRSHARRRAEVAVDWHLFGSDVHARSTTSDLSRGGAFVATAAPAPIGSPIVLAVATAAGPIFAHARVAWRTASGMGLRFTRALTREPV